ALHLIGRAYAAKAWHLDAMRELGRAVELQPDNIAARVDLGRSYIKLEGWADALKEADAIAAKEPANAFGLYFRAAALNARGDRLGAARIECARRGRRKVRGRAQGTRVASARELDATRSAHQRPTQRPDGTLRRGRYGVVRVQADLPRRAGRPVLARLRAHSF